MVWSRRQPLAGVGAVFSLLDGPTGCDPAFCLVWFRFRLLRGYLALWPTEVIGVYRLLEVVSKGSPGHGHVHLLSASAAEVGFRWDPLSLSWTRLGLLLLSNLAGPVKHFKAAFLYAWRNEVAADFCGRDGFRVDRCWMCMALCSFSILLMSGREIRPCFGVSWLVVSGMVSSWTGSQPGSSMSVLWCS